MLTDEYYMRIALQEANKALQKKEVPIGAVIVSNHKVIAKAHNQVEQWKDVTAHAEILAITAATNYLGAKYLRNCTLYVTLEPCTMCKGALYWSQLGRLVYGIIEEKKRIKGKEPILLHPRTQVKQGVLTEECRNLLKQFFQQKR